MHYPTKCGKSRILALGGLPICVGMAALSEGGMTIMLLDPLRKKTIIMPLARGMVQDMRELVQLAADSKVKTQVSRFFLLAGAGKIGSLMSPLASPIQVW